MLVYEGEEKTVYFIDPSSPIHVRDVQDKKVMVKASLTFMSTLGLTYVFGAAVFADPAIHWQYIFSIFNSLQVWSSACTVVGSHERQSAFTNHVESLSA